jgi:Fe-Mn family superoxide dismutase
MRIHHDVHHRLCVDRLNAIEKQLATLPGHADAMRIEPLERSATRHKSEHSLHCLFWEVMDPNQGGQPRGELAEQLARDFLSFSGFKAQFSAAATALEGGGWVALAWRPTHHRLVIVDMPGDQPLISSDIDNSVLALDVWRHAYHLKYKKSLTKYVHNWWNTVNWSRVAELFRAVTQPHAVLPRVRSERRSLR